MIQIRLTKKLQKEAGLVKGDLSEIEDGSSLLGNWFANMFYVDRKKVIIFMNEKSLFSFFKFGVNRKQIREMEDLFFQGLDHALNLEGFKKCEINRVFNNDTKIEYTSTNSRRVLGNLTDLVFFCKNYIFTDGVENCDFDEVTNKMNRIPQRNLDWGYSIDIMKQMVRGDE